MEKAKQHRHNSARRNVQSAAADLQQPMRIDPRSISGTGRQLAVVRLRGRTGLNYSVAVTLDLLNIQRVNHCTIVPGTQEVFGMVKKAKDYITWGPIDDDTLKALVEKRGELVAASDTKSGKKSPKSLRRLGPIERSRFGFAFNGKNYRPYFRLSPAKGGLGRRGIKASFTNSGALGDRKEKINDLIKKML